MTVTLRSSIRIERKRPLFREGKTFYQLTYWGMYTSTFKCCPPGYFFPASYAHYSLYSQGNPEKATRFLIQSQLQHVKLWKEFHSCSWVTWPCFTLLPLTRDQWKWELVHQPWNNWKVTSYMAQQPNSEHWWRKCANSFGVQVEKSFSQRRHEDTDSEDFTYNNGDASFTSFTDSDREETLVATPCNNQSSKHNGFQKETVYSLFIKDDHRFPDFQIHVLRSLVATLNERTFITGTSTVQCVI